MVIEAPVAAVAASIVGLVITTGTFVFSTFASRRSAVVNEAKIINDMLREENADLRRQLDICRASKGTGSGPIRRKA